MRSLISAPAPIPGRCWSYHWKAAGDRAVIRFTGKELRLDEPGALALAAELAALGPHEVSLDFRDVEFVGSSTRAMLEKVRGRLLAVGRSLYLCPLPPHLADAGLEGLFGA